ncbi:helix-hairpin-helix domain-containing protein [uncultured Bacteroides sp.]|uniref:helix-hairpin-helix domain-containing protein n=1 Tax=uncultured Bacteroides sp. TaxID=162156 RepID=UPI002AAC2EF7|nr:helix-hairpin-helix domain-containing protein [uncultured Bacteroides sp.]
MWKDFFYFSRRERQGIIGICLCIIIVVACTCFIPQRETKTNFSKKTSEKEYADFIHSLKKKKYKKHSITYPHYKPTKISLTAFDPNTADSIAFLHLGIRPWMTHNILRYRSKGGRFRKPEDFKKIYGLTKTQYTSLLPYIKIKDQIIPKDTINLLIKRRPADSLKNIKYPIGTVIDLNASDTTELKKIPGVGSVIARMIVRYRKRLGGYYKIEQLSEINLRVDKIKSWFHIKKGQTNQININKASIRRLMAHPYINFYQAKVIVEHRRINGPLNNLDELSFYSEFTKKDIERLSHYACFQ